ncbi:cytochrome c [Phaeocystidibacter luteus]|uniref:Cytochrome c n=1 Tax=Phaeocystidibacter luteus TaxID=911197 RepID=A0A6N6RCS4_9FLAO|nr:cytochrome c [Phaeocystidibacter luteus]KAB2805437.1 cytochrome c [Phaeocystidibacter luteus]
MKRTISILAVLTLVACGSAKLAAPTQADVDKASDAYPGYTLAQMNEGKGLYEQKCDKCHGLKDPTAFSPEQMREITPKMVEMANERQQSISADQAELIEKYLVTASMK